MNIPLVDLDAQYEYVGADIENAVEKVLQSGAYVRGPEVEKFETAWANFVEAPYCSAVSSGTSALELALKAHGIGQGDKVIVPAFTFIATAEAVVNVGATPIFVDVNDRGLIRPDQVIEFLDDADAVIPVHLYGQVANVEAFARQANSEGVVVIEDAAQAHDALYPNLHPVGYKRTCCWSFYPGKNLGACGDAGAVTTNNVEVDQKVKQLRNHGRADKFGHVVYGGTHRMSTIQAAVLLQKLPHLMTWTEHRLKAAKRYDELLEFPTIRTLDPDDKSSHHLYPVCLSGASVRNKVYEIMRDQGIGVGIHYPYAVPHTRAALPVRKENLNYDKKMLEVSDGHMSYVREDIHDNDPWPSASSWANDTLSLPLYPEITMYEQTVVVEKLKEAVEEVSDH